MLRFVWTSKPDIKHCIVMNVPAMHKLLLSAKPPGPLVQLSKYAFFKHGINQRAQRSRRPSHAKHSVDCQHSCGAAIYRHCESSCWSKRHITAWSVLFPCAYFTGHDIHHGVFTSATAMPSTTVFINGHNVHVGLLVQNIVWMTGMVVVLPLIAIASRRLYVIRKTSPERKAHPMTIHWVHAAMVHTCFLLVGFDLTHIFFDASILIGWAALSAFFIRRVLHVFFDRCQE